MKDPTVSSNHRPISIANSASKLIETLTLTKNQNFLASSDYRFVFKQDYSTEICILAVQETIKY